MMVASEQPRQLGQWRRGAPDQDRARDEAAHREFVVGDQIYAENNHGEVGQLLCEK